MSRARLLFRVQGVVPTVFEPVVEGFPEVKPWRVEDPSGLECCARKQLELLSAQWREQTRSRVEIAYDVLLCRQSHTVTAIKKGTPSSIYRIRDKWLYGMTPSEGGAANVYFIWLVFSEEILAQLRCGAPEKLRPSQDGHRLWLPCSETGELQRLIRHELREGVEEELMHWVKNLFKRCLRMHLRSPHEGKCRFWEDLNRELTPQNMCQLQRFVCGTG